MKLSTLPGAFRNPLDGRLVEPGRIIGYRRGGRPIYVIAGGDGTGGDGGQSGGQSGGNSGSGDGGQGGSGQGGNTGGTGGGTGQQGGQSGGQQQGGNTGGQGGGQGEPQLVDQLPGWAQRVISDLRRENAARRTGNNDGGQGNQGGQNGQQGSPGGSQQGQQGNGTAQTDEAIQAAQATARNSVVQFAAYRDASKNGADPDLLVENVTFLDKVKTLDPTADDFSTKLTAAIKKAVEDNPKLKAVQAAGRSGGEFTGGPGGGADTTPAPGKARIRAAYGS